MAVRPSNPLHLLLIAWIHSNPIITLLVISLPGAKADWLRGIIDSRTLFILLARVFEINLYTTLHKLIGMKFPMCLGQPFLGIRATQVLMISNKSAPSFKNSRHNPVVYRLPCPNTFGKKVHRHRQGP